MACDCIATIESKLDDQRLDYAIVFSVDGLAARPHSHLPRRDNGRRESRKGKPTLVIATYCPFCGVRYEPEPAQPAAAANEAA